MDPWNGYCIEPTLGENHAVELPLGDVDLIAGIDGRGDIKHSTTVASHRHVLGAIARHPTEADLDGLAVNEQVGDGEHPGVVLKSDELVRDYPQTEALNGCFF